MLETNNTKKNNYCFFLKLKSAVWSIIWQLCIFVWDCVEPQSQNCVEPQSQDCGSANYFFLPDMISWCHGMAHSTFLLSPNGFGDNWNVTKFQNIVNVNAKIVKIKKKINWPTHHLHWNSITLSCHTLLMKCIFHIQDQTLSLQFQFWNCALTLWIE